MTKLSLLQYSPILYPSIQDSRIKDGVTCRDYERINSSYGKCLNQALRKEFLENLDCLPPWMPDNLGEVCELDKPVYIKDKERYDRLTDNLLEFTSGRELDCWERCLPLHIHECSDEENRLQLQPGGKKLAQPEGQQQGDCVH